MLTVRGRTSGQPRSATVAVVGLDGRRWVIGAYGDVRWVRNLRAPGQAEIGVRGRTESVVARERAQADAADFYGRVLPAYIRRLPGSGDRSARPCSALSLPRFAMAPSVRL